MLGVLIWSWLGTEVSLVDLSDAGPRIADFLDRMLPPDLTWTSDEPVSSVDPARAEDILELFTEVQRRHGATLVMSLHQPGLARRFADRIVGPNL